MSTKPTQRETQRKVALEELIASARFLIARNQPNDWDAGVALLREVVKEDEGYQPFLQFILDQGKPPVPGEQREEAEPSGFWPQTQRYASQAWTKAVFYFWVVVVFLVNKTPLQSMFGLLEQPEATDTNASSSSSQQGRSQGANSQRKQKGMEFDGPRAAGDPLSFSAKDLPTEAILIPTGSKEAVNRILHVNERDLYRILCVPATATAAELKRAYRLQSLRLHPDKNTHPKAEAAFKRLNYAYDILSDQAARSNYHAEIQAQMSMSDFESAVKSQTEEFVKSMKQKAAKISNQIPCDKCKGHHDRIATSRQPFGARFCHTHNTHHNAKEGDVWAESNIFGYNRKFYACMKGGVFDVTEWAECQDIGQVVKPGDHQVLLRFTSVKQQKPTTSDKAGKADSHSHAKRRKPQKGKR
eukprot:m.25385 g.25385  ORF g.25385 m.25385 type:complete len:414 (+) comp8698_c0_seq4:158-1399(+)